MNISKYKLGIIELYFPPRHDESLCYYNPKNIGHYTCVLPITLRTFYNKRCIDLMIHNYYHYYETHFFNLHINDHLYHPNFENMVKNTNYFNVKIIHVIQEKERNHVIDKTSFFKIFQRKLKKYYSHI